MKAFDELIDVVAAHREVEQNVGQNVQFPPHRGHLLPVCGGVHQWIYQHFRGWDNEPPGLQLGTGNQKGHNGDVMRTGSRGACVAASVSLVDDRCVVQPESGDLNNPPKKFRGFKHKQIISFREDSALARSASDSLNENARIGDNA
ncbi:Inositol 1,4,5-trisphosphate receptor type 1 [Anabarilius grahami]|uniref:Inositol 1,4,5-trisphosphate receptor type 1 n=1 Tax=Anabarilius grahami TaxID=495550 RepID=A0A3N0XG20_ANAGA|nr:Inositol 1,4,5-trisphosphate receptor type 1 [Anabarilius grahami]